MTGRSHTLPWWDKDDRKQNTLALLTGILENHIENNATIYASLKVPGKVIFGNYGQRHILRGRDLARLPFQLAGRWGTKKLKKCTAR
jgi:hypothetical protein